MDAVRGVIDAVMDVVVVAVVEKEEEVKDDDGDDDDGFPLDQAEHRDRGWKRDRMEVVDLRQVDLDRVVGYPGSGYLLLVLLLRRVVLDLSVHQVEELALRMMSMLLLLLTMMDAEQVLMIELMMDGLLVLAEVLVVKEQQQTL